MTGARKGSFRPESFVGKLRSLRVGESLMLDDYGGDNSPTRLERDLQTQLARSPALAGRRFTGRRVRWIDGDLLRHAYRITREPDVK